MDDDYEEDNQEQEGMMFQIGEDGVLRKAPETVEMDAKEAEILSAFLNKHNDVREKLAEFAKTYKHKED